MASRPTIQKILKGILQPDDKDKPAQRPKGIKKQFQTNYSKDT